MSACESIFYVKGRPLIDPLIVHVANRESASPLAQWNNCADALAKHFWPGPLTLVLPKSANMPDIVTAGLPSVALRSPSHPVARAVLEMAGLPLAAPSANRFAALSPTTAQHVASGLGDALEYILDGGPCAVGLESTIVDVRNPEKLRILRPGAISAKEIAEALGLNEAIPTGPANAEAESDAHLAPGNMDKHYSPRTPLYLLPSGECLEMLEEGVATILFQRPAANAPTRPDTYWLTEDGDPAQAAQTLYALLHRLDTRGYPSLWVETAPAKDGVCSAINDRLRRAASK